MMSSGSPETQSTFCFSGATFRDTKAAGRCVAVAIPFCSVSEYLGIYLCRLRLCFACINPLVPHEECRWPGVHVHNRLRITKSSHRH
jgi:hypothetical protein